MVKGLFFGFFGIIFGIIFLLLIGYIFVRILLNKNGFKNKSISSIYHEAKHMESLDKQRHKQVSGMTKILLPEIQRDFADFNEKEIYTLVEKGLIAIFNALENKNLSYLDDDNFNIIREKIKNQIIDLQENNVTYAFDDIVFHRHAIKSYRHQRGAVTLEISTSLEYYYIKRKDNKNIFRDDVKRQTRYTTTLVYIVDNTKTGFDINVLGLHCPNCGSPLHSLNQKKCSYCKGAINIEIANLLKCWKIIDYKEDY